MSLTTVQVAIATNMITGAALPLARVRIELSGIDIDGGIVTPSVVTLELNDAGTGVVALWPNARGSQGTQYRVTIYDRKNKLQFAGLATLPAADCNLHDALLLPALDPVSSGAKAVADARGYAQSAAASLAGMNAYNLQTWAVTQAFRLVTATRNSDGAITSAQIEWPDGTTGTYTADALSANFPGATDAWHATYAGSVAKTVTQPAVTRNSEGAVTVQPAITIS